MDRRWQTERQKETGRGKEHRSTENMNVDGWHGLRPLSSDTDCHGRKQVVPNTAGESAWAQSNREQKAMAKRLTWA